MENIIYTAVYLLLFFIILYGSHYIGLGNALLKIPENIEVFIEHFIQYRLGYLQGIAFLLTTSNAILMFNSQRGIEGNLVSAIIAISIALIGYFNILIAFEVGFDKNPNTKLDDYIGRTVSLLIALFVIYIVHSILFMKYGMAKTWGDCSLFIWRESSIFNLYSKLNSITLVKFAGIIFEYIIAFIIAVTPSKKNDRKITFSRNANPPKEQPKKEVKQETKQETKEEKLGENNSNKKIKLLNEVFTKKPENKNLPKSDKEKWIELMKYKTNLNDNEALTYNQRVALLKNKGTQLGLSAYV